MRSWLLIPATGLVASVAVLALARFAPAALGAAAAAAIAAAAIAHAARVLAPGASSGESPAALVGVVLAALLAIASIAVHPAAGPAAYLALAAAAWTVAELARGTSPPIVAMLPAVVATVLSPACAPLLAIASVRLAKDPRAPRWAIVVPIAGALVAVVAIMAGAADDGALARLGVRWYGTPAHAGTSPAHALARLGDALGPMAAVAALAGAILLVRVHLANLALGACLTGALLADLRAGTPGTLSLGLAALCAGVAVARLGGMVRLASGQVIVAITCAAMLLMPPAWIAIAASG